FALLLAGCASGPDASATAAPSGAAGARGRADDLLPVDCLLPGQIRQLGGQLTFVTARRAVKTSARDCEIRGGEYTAFDRADYRTALKVWLPLAQEGDPKAQTVVGEIYEKGLGVAPDYQAARAWYLRAAEKGYAPAAMNLGALYEQGLGVPKDQRQALIWYRRAAGLPDLAFGVPAPAPSAKPSAEEERLRAELAKTQRERDAKQAELDRALRERDDLRTTVDARRTESDSDRGALAKLRQELDASRKNEQAAATRLRDAEKSVAARETQLAARDKEIADLRAALSRSESTSAAKKADVDRLQQRIASESGAQRAELERQRSAAAADLAKAQAEIDGLRKSLAERGRAADSERGQLATLKQDLDVARRGEQAATARGKELEKQVAASEARLATKDRELADMRAKLARSEQGEAAARAEVARLQAQQQQLSAVHARSAGPAGARPVGLRARAPVAFGTYHALVIGNNNYRQLRRLRTAVHDAREVARILESSYGFKVTLLLDADRYQMLSALNTLRETLTEKDNLLIYYAGHGELDAKNQRGYWLPVDAEPGSNANWISNVMITDILNAMNVQQLLVVADSCYSGTLTRDAVANLAGGISEQEKLRVIQVMAQKKSRMVMTSGGVEPVLDSTGGIHSAFAQSFIEVLRSNVGLLPGQDLYLLMRARVTATAMRVEGQQLPEYAPIKYAGHEAGEFVFVRKG
ncbi:MAG TPA: caspase family protein, partial [Methylomirabilota bacterium]|nr:caspase family protein [Methylomirabilota bacterium]